MPAIDPHAPPEPASPDPNWRARSLTGEAAGLLPPALTERAALRRHAETVRRETLHRVEGLSTEDQCAQAMPDASPAKWHLAHTTWFFEAVVLGPIAGRPSGRPDWHRLFNSYYEGLGPRHPRPQRGLLTRPSLTEVLTWRAEVDRALVKAIDTIDDARWPELRRAIEIGLAHEAQHQELILTDALALLACHPHEPAWLPVPASAHVSQPAPPPRAITWHPVPPGTHWIGHADHTFAFDHESPAHEVILTGFAMADRPVNGHDVMRFIADEGYHTAAWWSSEGWSMVQANQWHAPAGWAWQDGIWTVFGRHGRRPLDPDVPVSHLSYHEAQALAAWADARLPTEAEWETWARRLAVPDWAMRPLPHGLGQVWEWTGSSFEPYPRYRAWPGVLAEYNGKFMVGQQVLRGASWATPAWETRPTYRNFFPPSARWQFSGVRLARDH